MTVIAGRYRLLDVLSEGASGTVWRALDETDRHEVALREFRAPAGLPADEVPLLYARREREARAAARISHPSAVRILGVATEDGRPWVVTELVRGLSLAETLEAAGPLPPREAARVGAEVLGALRAAREAGAPHRGVEPRHVLLANDGRVVVTGFGTAPGDDPGPEADLRSVGALLDAAASAPPASLPPSDPWAGVLRTVVEGLLRGDPGDTDRPDRALSADGAERELRRVASGGARTTAGAREAQGTASRGGTSAPREEDTTGRKGSAGREEGGAREESGGREKGGGNAVPGGPGSDRMPRGARPPRRTLVLLAGLVGALLIAGALTYHLVRG
ncbi:protein kinase [Streptomyces zaomyceticus]|uniref:protein kinase domain-containing protein n=1 Tax=Streptomyces zaomyceticus TaxID=68286 RepID=UPI0037208FE8